MKWLWSSRNNLKKDMKVSYKDIHVLFNRYRRSYWFWLIGTHTVHLPDSNQIILNEYYWIAISSALEKPKEEIKIDDLFTKLNELREYYINTSYCLTPYDSKIYKEV